jgi:hypothetical protein
VGPGSALVLAPRRPATMAGGRCTLQPLPSRPLHAAPRREDAAEGKRSRPLTQRVDRPRDHHAARQEEVKDGHHFREGPGVVQKERKNSARPPGPSIEVPARQRRPVCAKMPKLKVRRRVVRNLALRWGLAAVVCADRRSRATVAQEQAQIRVCDVHCRVGLLRARACPDRRRDASTALGAGSITCDHDGELGGGSARTARPRDRLGVREPATDGAAGTCTPRQPTLLVLACWR